MANDDGKRLWEETKKLLDDPHVPKEEKAALLHNFPHLALRDLPEEERERIGREFGEYCQKNGVEPNPWRANDLGQFKRFQDAFDKAEKSAAEGADKQYNEDRQKGKEKLDESARQAADGDAGCSNSDELLDAGAPALKYFETFLPLYQKISGAQVRKMVGPEATFDNVRKRYDEQRHIDFAKFSADANELTEAARTQREQHAEMANKLAALWNHWEGQASQKSQEYFANYSKSVDKAIQSLNDTAGVINASCKAVAEQVRTKANWVLENITDINTAAGKNPRDIELIIDVVNGGENCDEWKLKRACAIFNIEVDDGCLDSEEFKSEVVRQATAWVNTAFAPEVEGRYDAFMQTCDNVKEGVDEAWKVLTDHLAKVEENPFASTGENSGGDQGRGGGGGGGGGGTGGGGGGGGGGFAGGGGGGGFAGGGGGGFAGGGGGGGGAPSMSIPEMPKPEVPEPGGELQPDGQDSLQTMPGVLDPSQQDGVTIEEGDRKITVSRPDDQGNVRLTVEGPDGQPKTYDIDFDLGGPGEAQDDIQSLGPYPADQGAGSFPVNPGQAPDEQGTVQTLRPGPDGKAVIQDGDVTITAEYPPGQSDRLLVTIDTGDGTPTTYTVEFDEQGKATLSEAAVTSARAEVITDQGGAGGAGAPRPQFGPGGGSDDRAQPMGLRAEVTVDGRPEDAVRPMAPQPESAGTAPGPHGIGERGVQPPTGPWGTPQHPAPPPPPMYGEPAQHTPAAAWNGGHQPQPGWQPQVQPQHWQPTPPPAQDWQQATPAQQGWQGGAPANQSWQPTPPQHSWPGAHDPGSFGPGHPASTAPASTAPASFQGGAAGYGSGVAPWSGGDAGGHAASGIAGFAGQGYSSGGYGDPGHPNQGQGYGGYGPGGYPSTGYGPGGYSNVG
ncbi:MAG TPA: WXG100 family type VII secretion target, partial [Pseudonocardiaceae bacterium]